MIYRFLFPILGMVILVVSTAVYLSITPFNYEWPSGKAAVYLVEYKSTGDSKGNKPGTLYSIIEKQSVKIDVKGELSVQKSKHRDNLIYVNFSPKIFDYTYSKNGKEYKIHKSNISFMVDWTFEDGFGDFVFVDNLDQEYIHFIKDIMNSVNLKVDKRNEFQWTKLHEAITGDEDFTYTYMPSIFGLNNAYIKKKHEIDNDLRYKKVDDKLVFSNLTLLSVSSKVSETMSIEGVPSIVNNKVLSLAFDSFRDVDISKSIVVTNIIKKANLSGKYALKRLNNQTDINIVDGRSFEQIISPLLSNSGFEISTQANLFQDLSAYLRLYPEKVVEVYELLKQYSRPDLQFDLISTALGSLGTEQAQSLMKEYILNSSGEEKNQVMLNLAFTKNPTKETENLFWDIYEKTDDQSEKSSAIFGVGIIASHLEKDSPRYIATINRMKQGLNSATNVVDKERLIKAAANARSERFHEDFASVIVNDDELRLTALASLKSILSEESKNTLIKYSYSENKEEKFASIIGLSTHDVSSDVLDTYEESLFNEGNEKIKIQILKNMARHKNEPGVEDLAAEYKRVCPTSDLCKLSERVIR